jgi:hypothetical protein
MEDIWEEDDEDTGDYIVGGWRKLRNEELDDLSSTRNVIRITEWDRLCGRVVRVLVYRSRGPGSIPCTTRKRAVFLERGPLSLVSTTEELLDRKVAAPV